MNSVDWLRKFKEKIELDFVSFYPNAIYVKNEFNISVCITEITNKVYIETLEEMVSYSNASIPKRECTKIDIAKGIED